jgi:hypothetical protein
VTTGGGRKKQVLVACGILGALGLVLVLLLPLSYLPGTAGMFFARIAGIITTPFLMEATLAVIGLLVVLLLNHWRRLREGDELVYLDELPGASGSKTASVREGTAPRD